jgi:hypothetical protein
VCARASWRTAAVAFPGLLRLDLDAEAWQRYKRRDREDDVMFDGHVRVSFFGKLLAME